MAAIAGTLDLVPGLPPATPLVRSMLAACAHRGPGGETVLADGAITLGARALPLLDGDSAAWHGDRYDLVLDADLLGDDRAQAQRVLEAWSARGATCLDELEGGFALAVWDRARQRLSLVRDRFGTKPLYLVTAAGRLRFASELKGLLVDPAVRREPDEERIAQYLAYGVADHGTATMLHGVRRVPASSVLEIDGDGRESERRWYRFDPAPDDGPVADRVRALVERSTAARLATSGTVGVTLSGGLDSATVFATATALGGRPPVAVVARTADAGLDEWPYARALVERVGADVVEVRPDAGSLAVDADRFLLALDEPCHGPSVYGHWRTLGAAREAGIDVVLEGQFGERLGGVSEWYPTVLFDLLARGRVAGFVRQVLDRRRIEGVGPKRSLVDLAKLLAPLPVRARHRRVPPWLLPAARVTPPPLQPRRYLDRQRYVLEVEDVPLLCREVDRDASTFGLVERAPFQDARFVEYSLSVPPELLYRGGWGKAPLRDAMADLLPEAIVRRPTKQGFTVDAAAWWRGRFGDVAAEVLAGDAAASRPYWDPVAVARLVGDVRTGRAPAVEAWRAWSVERWLELVVDAQ